jgi:hypothetical protein
MRMATRILELQTRQGRVEVPIHIDVPEMSGGSWRCRYEIGWPGGAKTMTAWGVDSVQAIVLALQMIGTDLYTSGHHKAGELSSGEGEGGYGFPVPANLRDLLTGDDAKYF